MEKTHLIPWQHEPIILTILTKRELTEHEKAIVCKAFIKDTPPYGLRPYRSLSQLVEELRQEGEDYLASLIVFPSWYVISAQ